MKKVFLFVVVVAMSIAASATDLWTGSKHVSWSEGGLQIAANQFAAAQPGNLLKVHFTGASDGIEFKVMNANFDHLAGSREAAWINGDGAFEQFLTQTAVDSLKAYGLEIIGANFTCTRVELLESKTLKDVLLFGPVSSGRTNGARSNSTGMATQVLTSPKLLHSVSIRRLTDRIS